MDFDNFRLPYFLILKMRALDLFGLMERSFTWYFHLRLVSIIAPIIIHKIFQTNSSFHVK